MDDEVVKHCKNCKKDIATANFIIHSAVCERTIQLCGRCDEPFKQGCLELHNENFHTTINCSYCDAEIEKWTLKKHMTACFRRPVPCSFCDITKPLDELSEHMEFCGARTDKCPTCKQFVLLRDLKTHKDICQNQLDGFESYNIAKYKNINKEVSHSTITDTRIGSEVGATSKKEQNLERNNFLRYKRANNEALYSDLSDKRIGEVGALSQPVYRKCQYCNIEKPLDEFSEHVEVCGARTEKCSICKQFVLLREFERHKVMCMKQQKHFERSDFGRYKDIVNEDSLTSDKRIGDGVRAMSEAPLEKPCPYCKTNFPKMEIVDHMIECGQSYKCSLCLETVPRRNKNAHEKFCSSVMGNRSKESTQAVEMSSNKSSNSRIGIENKTSNYMGVCHICKRNIPWVDMNTHIPSCATFNNKCSRCGEEVSSEQLKDHMLRLCPALKCNKSGAQSLEMPSRNRSRISIEDISRETIEQQCPFCSKFFPEPRYENHLKYCSQREKKCHFCKMVISVADEKNHLNYCIGLNPAKDECYAATNLSSYNEAVRGYKAKERDRIPAEHFEQETKSSCCSASPCNKNTILCKFCGDKIPKCEEIKHLKVCAVDQHDKYRKIIPANDEWKKRDGRNSGAVSKHSRISNDVESSYEKCIHCNVYFNTTLDPNHMHTCVQNLGKCTLCDTIVTLSNFRKHLENDCLKYKDDEKWSTGGSKKKKKNKSKKNSSTPPKEKNIWNFFKKLSTAFRMSSEYDATMENSRVYEADRNFPLVYEKSASDIKLPCEFCEKLFPMESLIEHQSGCRPDLVHFPPTHDSQDVMKASDLLATNLLDENSFSADTEFTMPQMRRKLNRNLLPRFDTDATPGSFLEEYNTYEEKKDQCPRKEEYEFDYVANSKKTQSNRNGVEILPTKHTSVSSNDLEITKPKFSSSLSNPNTTGANFRNEKIIEKEPKFSTDDCKREENKNVKITTFSNQNEMIASSSSEESIDEGVKSKAFSHQNEMIGSSSSGESIDEDVKSKTLNNQNETIGASSSGESSDEGIRRKIFSYQNEVIDLSSSDESVGEVVKSKKNSIQNEVTNVSSSDESIDEENIDAYITYLSKKHEIEDVNDDEITNHIYQLEENLSIPFKSGLLSSIPKRKTSFEAKKNAALICGNSDMNADESHNGMLLSDDDELEAGHDNYSAPVKSQTLERDSVKQFLDEINCELRKKKLPEFNTEDFLKWRTAKHSAMDSRFQSSSSSSSDTD